MKYRSSVNILKNLYSNRLENVEEMDKFLDTKLSQEGINILNRSITEMKLK
jgi:hypothetical protein